MWQKQSWDKETLISSCVYCFKHPSCQFKGLKLGDSTNTNTRKQHETLTRWSQRLTAQSHISISTAAEDCGYITWQYPLSEILTVTSNRGSDVWDTNCEAAALLYAQVKGLCQIKLSQLIHVQITVILLLSDTHTLKLCTVFTVIK